MAESPTDIVTLSRADVEKIQRALDWIKNFNIRGPYVTGTNGPSGAAFWVGSPKNPALQIAAAKGAMVRPTATIANGKYTGNVVTLAPTFSSAAPADTSEWIQGQACVIVHSWEIIPGGATGHDLYTDSDTTTPFHPPQIFPATYIGTTSATDAHPNLPIYAIGGIQSFICPPVTGG